MWYRNSNGSADKPSALDETSSRVYVYVRKNFALVPERVVGDGMEPEPEHWEWDEMKVPKADWAVYAQVMGHDAALEDVYAALTELAGMVAEG